MTQEEFIAQLDEGEIETLEIASPNGTDLEVFDAASDLERLICFIHYGLVETRSQEESGWVYLALTDAGRAAIARFKERAS